METRPYVNSSMLQDHVGRYVAAIGKVTNVSPTGNELKVMMSDNREVKIALKDTAPFKDLCHGLKLNNRLSESDQTLGMLQEMLQGYVQITGKVERDCSLTAEHLISFGSGEIDLNMYNEALQVASRYPELFSYGQMNGGGF